MIESTTRALGDFRIFIAERDHCAAGYRNVLMLYWRGAITSESIRRTRAWHGAVYAKHPDGLGVFVVATDQVPIPDPRLRDESASIIRQTAGQVLCQSTTLEGGGFWGAAARSAVTLINMISSPPNPTRVFADADEAARWQAPYLVRAGTTPEGLRDAMRQMREASAAVPVSA